MQLRSFGDLERFIADQIKRSFGDLLNGGHLYQHRDIDLEALESSLPAAVFREGAADMLRRFAWYPGGHALYAPQRVAFAMPNVEAYCDKCQARKPFNLNAGDAGSTTTIASQFRNSVPPQVNPVGYTSPLGTHEFSRQFFMLVMQCQGCKTSLVTFLISRQPAKTDNGQKSVVRLTLVGRGPIEVIESPKSLPKSLRKYYSAAVLAFHSGQMLPALFMLRTLIEQHMRASVLAELKVRRGDELCEAYKSLLPDDFKARFPSLADTYQNLSGALHEAREDRALFESELEKVHEHFDAVFLFKLRFGAF